MAEEGITVVPGSRHTPGQRSSRCVGSGSEASPLSRRFCSRSLTIPPETRTAPVCRRHSMSPSCTEHSHKLLTYSYFLKNSLNTRSSNDPMVNHVWVWSFRLGTTAIDHSGASSNLHLRQRRVSRWVGEEELEAVGCHLHVGREDEHHGALIHVPLGETTFDVSSWQDGTIRVSTHLNM